MDSIQVTPDIVQWPGGCLGPSQLCPVLCAQTQFPLLTPFLFKNFALLFLIKINNEDKDFSDHPHIPPDVSPISPICFVWFPIFYRIQTGPEVPGEMCGADCTDPSYKLKTCVFTLTLEHFHQDLLFISHFQPSLNFFQSEILHSVSVSGRTDLLIFWFQKNVCKIEYWGQYFSSPPYFWHCI